jgi:hypothetical protein
MKKIAVLVVAILALAACKKPAPPVDTSVPLEKRIPGTWNITQISYSGIAPNPISPGNFVPFSGTGQNVDGFFMFQSNPNIGEFSVSFLASIDLGLAQPITLPVSQSHYGEWKVNGNDDIVTMWRNDSIFDWNVLENLDKKQTWATRFYLDFGTPYDSVPCDVQATMTR